MRIAFDQQIFSWQEYGGISRYFCSLATHLSKVHDVEAKIFAPLHVNGYLPLLAQDIKTGIKVKKVPKTARLRIRASHLMAMPLIWLFRPDILHETYYSSSANTLKGACRVLTAFDMIHERFADLLPHNDPTTHLKKMAFSRADYIFCISENTRRDLMELYAVPADKTSVTYLGFDMLPAEGEESFKHSSYILYVGQRLEYKNFTGLVNAFASSKWLRNNFRILCFGGGSFTSAENELFKALGIAKSQILQISGDDTVLSSCYRNAAAFVYPSLYEGFGIPPLEAMSVGCPVVCSNTSSIPEVVGDAAEYFDPFNVESIRSAIEKILQSSELRSELMAKGFKRCRLFTWEKCAAETLAVYRKLRNLPVGCH
jgi:glycosyltransferase involved in cell wall biosynthesis